MEFSYSLPRLTPQCSIISEIEDKRIITYPQADNNKIIKTKDGRTFFTLEISPKVHSPTNPHKCF